MVVGAIFVVLIQFRGPLLVDLPITGYLFAGVALVQLGAAFGVLRPRVPPRRPDQSADVYWQANEVRSAALLLWMIVDGAGVFGWVGYGLSGQTAAAALALLAIGALIMFRPSQLEDRGAA